MKYNVIAIFVTIMYLGLAVTGFLTMTSGTTYIASKIDEDMIASESIKIYARYNNLFYQDRITSSQLRDTEKLLLELNKLGDIIKIKNKTSLNYLYDSTATNNQRTIEEAIETLYKEKTITVNPIIVTRGVAGDREIIQGVEVIYE